jgi:hypothetical protein
MVRYGAHQSRTIEMTIVTARKDKAVSSQEYTQMDNINETRRGLLIGGALSATAAALPSMAAGQAQTPSAAAIATTPPPVTSKIALRVNGQGHEVNRDTRSKVGQASRESFMKIRLIVGNQHATANLYDNATARDFAALLPLSLTMEDYASIERVANLPRKLAIQEAPEGLAPVAGELTHYAPWGNLAIFIEGRSYARSLLPLGKVDEGLSMLAQPGPYRLRIERVQD